MARLAATAAASVLLAISVPMASAAIATPTVTWTQAPPGPPRFGNAAAFDPGIGSLGTLVSFGGNVRGVYQSTTLLFDPARGAWTTIAAPASPRPKYPTARAFAGMSWDPGRQQAILFGGTNGPSLQDTWAFDPATKTWAPLVTNCRKFVCPPARWDLEMVWSSKLGASLVFGGESGRTMLDDLWAYSTSWAAIAPAPSARPAGRRAFGMAEDPTTGKILVYGGLGTDSGSITFSDTWVLDPVARTWTQVVTPTIPDTRAGMAMAWLGSIGKIVMTGGQDAAGYATTSTWAFDASAGDWVRVIDVNAPSTPRGCCHSLTANTVDGSAILFGDPSNASGTATDTTWILR